MERFARKNPFSRCFLLTLCLFVLMITPDIEANADVVVIVSVTNSAPVLTAEQVARIFLGKTETFPNGGKALPIDQPQGSALRNEFYLKVSNKIPSQITAYWAKIIFTGEGNPPRVVENSEETIDVIANSPNTIGYVDKKAVNTRVRIVFDPTANSK